jgi:hypothetical protein
MPTYAVDPSAVLTVKRRWTVREFGEEMAPRFLNLVTRENSPRVLPDAVAAWSVGGLLFEQATTLAASNWVGAAGEWVDIPMWPAWRDAKPALEWGYFNPLGGSTLNQLFCISLQDGRVAIAHAMHHGVQARSCELVGIAEMNAPDAIRVAVRRAFERNGTGHRWLVSSLPDYVTHDDQLGHMDDAPSWFGVAHEAACAVGVEWCDPDRQATRLQRLAKDPHGTVRRELTDAARDWVASEPDPPRTPMGATDYTTWFRVAVDENHAKGIRRLVAETLPA